LSGAAGPAIRSSIGCACVYRGTRSVLSRRTARFSAIALAQARILIPSSTHLVLIPSYNPGPKVFSTVRAALDQWAPVWVVVDGSTDHSEHALAEMAAADPGLRIWVLPENRGKGAAVLFGLREAQALGFTHALT